MRRHLAFIKNSYVEMTFAGILAVIPMLEMRHALLIEQQAWHHEGYFAVLFFGIFWLLRCATSFFEALELLDDGAERKWHGSVLLAIHRFVHRPHTELAVGCMLCLVGIMEVWHNLHAEAGGVNWQIGLAVFGLFMLLRGLSAILKEIDPMHEGQQTLTGGRQWIHQIHGLLNKPVLHIVLGLALILVSVWELFEAGVHQLDVYLKEEFMALLLLGTYTSMKAVAEIFEGLEFIEEE